MGYSTDRCCNGLRQVRDVDRLDRKARRQKGLTGGSSGTVSSSGNSRDAANIQRGRAAGHFGGNRRRARGICGKSHYGLHRRRNR